MKLFIISLTLVTVAKTLPQEFTPKSPFTSRISNGTFANVGHFPFAVALYQDEENITCSGTLVSYQHILTSAWCVLGSEKVQYAMAGDAKGWKFEDSPSTRTFLKVIRSTPHPEALDYFNNHNQEILNEHNIAILETETPFPTNENIQMIEIVQKEIDIGTLALVLGFGLGANSLSLYHIGISYLRVRTMECPNEVLNIDGTMICAASTKGASGRPGDRGGPLVSLFPPYILYGSFSDLAGRMNLFVSARDHQDWIEAQLQYKVTTAF